MKVHGLNCGISPIDLIEQRVDNKQSARGRLNLSNKQLQVLVDLRSTRNVAQRVGDTLAT